MFQKKGKWLIFLLALTLMLSACSSGGGSSSDSKGTDEGSSSQSGDSSGGSSSDKKVTIVYATGKEETGTTAEIIKAFEKKYPNINVKHKNMPNDSGKQHDTYVTMFNAKSSAIDVFDIDVVWPAELAQAGYILPLDRFVQQDNFDLSMYNQGALSAAKFKGKQWALPRFIDVGMLYYRKDIVDHAPKTWEDLMKMAKENKGKNGTKFGYVFQGKQYEGLVCNATEFIHAYGGAIVKDGKVVVNNPNTIQGLKAMVKIANSDYVPNNVTTFAEPETNVAFTEGQSVFARNWPYMWATSGDKANSEVVGKVGVAPLPAGDAGSFGSLGGWMTAINAYSKHKEAAWKFLKFVAGPEGQKMFAVGAAHAPTITKLYQDKDVLKANPFFGKKGFKEAVKSAVSRPVAANYQEISNIIQIHVSKAIAGQETVKQAVQKMETELKKAMNQ